MDTRIKKNLQEIDNLLEDNLNLMIEIDNIIDKNEKQIVNIKNSNLKVENNNNESYKFLHRMNNFFYRIYTYITGEKEINNINIEKEFTFQNNKNNYKDNSKLEIMKEKSKGIKIKLTNQNEDINNINNLVDRNNEQIKKNIRITDKI